MAQMFSTVSPRMFKEFEVRMIPNVRKVSMSPWINEERGAEEIGCDFVYSRKSSPALLVVDNFNPERVRENLTATKNICARYGCPLEFILKDISTVRYQPERLFQWAAAAMQVVGG